MIVTRVQREDFAIAAELARLDALGGGAVASFTGIVRGDGGLAALTLEHYPAMTERAMADIAAEASARWPLLGGIAAHRIGRLEVGARIVFVATASRHRSAALESCHFLIDWLKTSAPFWKREEWLGGHTRWVDAHSADGEATARWNEGKTPEA